MKKTVTSDGTCITILDPGEKTNHRIVMMRTRNTPPSSVGRIVTSPKGPWSGEPTFQPAPFAGCALSATTLRALADLIEDPADPRSPTEGGDGEHSGAASVDPLEVVVRKVADGLQDLLAKNGLLVGVGGPIRVSLDLVDSLPTADGHLTITGTPVDGLMLWGATGHVGNRGGSSGHGG